jgi:hypothetical protein
MTTSPGPQPVPLPIGAVFADVWEVEDPLPQRLVTGPYRRVTGSDSVSGPPPFNGQTEELRSSSLIRHESILAGI